MSPEHGRRFEELLSMHFLAHHAVSPGPDAPGMIECIVEMPADCPVKIELSKASGLPRIDRPQKYSSRNPTPYGLFPQTYCGPRVASLCMKRTKLKNMVGDGDPLDVCVLTSSNLPPMTALQMRVRPIGGLPMVDRKEADDKIIAVLENDPVYGEYQDIREVPESLLQQLEHYFLSYKRPPGKDGERVVSIKGRYGRKEALAVIKASMEDYEEKYLSSHERLVLMQQLLTEAVTGQNGKAPKAARRKR